MKYLSIFIYIGIVLIIVGVFLAVAHGMGRGRGLEPYHNATNNTASMLYSDNWSCGFITNKTTLEDLRECYRD